MKKLLSLLLALSCLMSLAACGGESIRMEYDADKLYPGNDIHLTFLYADSAAESVKILVENNSSHELIFGHPFFTFSRKTAGGWKCISPDPNWAYTLEACYLSPGESAELEMSTVRYLEELRPEETYRACFEFWYSTDNPEADGSGNFQSIQHEAYLLCDFEIPAIP